MAEPQAGAQEGESTIRSSVEHRRRAALSAGGLIAGVLTPIGLLLAFLSHNWEPLLLFWFAGLVVGISSYVGQGRNEVFVGPLGIRKVSQNCNLTASWSSLLELRVSTPGEQIVIFVVATSGLEVERLGSGRSHAAEVLLRHPPEGFSLRLDRGAADALVAEIGQRRPDLRGLAEWPRASRPA